ncbi:MAG: diaminopimelate decarboxylase [Gammaproteobacteria bacterium]|nr:diaminopimelate decarboxylase [Gammaproteobacteria bacterium]MBT5117012.1 diaminopimelate decarboxylase [Gammaproteobacteria bacterium]MBT5762045.1 diaminopimelate decarboxylase [Gammaproteobacteria bacterium]MBT6331619.1 diaminopimelate decarboxylase [Gammaproteobacteria bacterium]MBT7932269.1 diaminopimelate decarboxylase [Gammaproteobacteria bacterium]
MSTIYNDDILFFDGINVLDFALINQTPFYLYSEKIITDNFLDYQNSFGDNAHLICYSVKANSNLSVLSLLAKLGSGFDIVSGGELSRVIMAGGDPKKTVFSGVGKTEEEIRFALASNIMCFNVESYDELMTINAIALEEKVIASISIRINPEIDVNTHPYITTGMKDNKFGIEQSDILEIYTMASKLNGIKITGIDCHIGSQITDLKPFEESVSKIISIINLLKNNNIQLNHIDIGGGLGISYNNEESPNKSEFISRIIDLLKPLATTILIEPGRSIVGEAGILVSKVVNTKSTPSKKFIIVDAGMSDLLRPPLYNAFHAIKEVFHNNESKFLCDVVGPICETADFLGKDRTLSLSKGDYIAIECVGAYGFTLSSNYNTRLKPAEYIINKDTKSIREIRKRDTIDQILDNEIEYL